MSSDTRDRFLIALAKFLGENPAEANPLHNVQVCADWLMQEVLATILLADSAALSLDREKFNRLMLNCGRRKVTEHFYSYFFSSVTDVEGFEKAVDRYRVKAMWVFGNFK